MCLWPYSNGYRENVIQTWVLVSAVINVAECLRGRMEKSCLGFTYLPDSSHTLLISDPLPSSHFAPLPFGNLDSPGTCSQCLSLEGETGCVCYKVGEKPTCCVCGDWQALDLNRLVVRIFECVVSALTWLGSDFWKFLRFSCLPHWAALVNRCVYSTNKHTIVCHYSSGLASVPESVPTPWSFCTCYK